MSRLRTYAPMQRAPKPKVPGLVIPGFKEALDALLGPEDPVYAAVDQRSEGRCEVDLGARCQKPMQDHHHTRKPRRQHHTVDEVIAICRTHHNRVDWPYARGRLVIHGLGGGVFEYAIVTAPDKFTYRRRALALTPESLRAQRKTERTFDQPPMVSVSLAQHEAERAVIEAARANYEAP